MSLLFISFSEIPNESITHFILSFITYSVTSSSASMASSDNQSISIIFITHYFIYNFSVSMPNTKKGKETL